MPRFFIHELLHDPPGRYHINLGLFEVEVLQDDDTGWQALFRFAETGTALTRAGSPDLDSALRTLEASVRFLYGQIGSLTRQHMAYLVAHFDTSGSVPQYLGSRVYSEPAASLTSAINNSRMALDVYQGTGDSYQQALDNLNATLAAMPRAFGPFNPNAEMVVVEEGTERHRAWTFRGYRIVVSRESNGRWYTSVEDRCHDDEGMWQHRPGSASGWATEAEAVRRAEQLVHLLTGSSHIEQPQDERYNYPTLDADPWE